MNPELMQTCPWGLDFRVPGRDPKLKTGKAMEPVSVAGVCGVSGLALLALLPGSCINPEIHGCDNTVVNYIILYWLQEIALDIRQYITFF
jgi:hypothetical protein